ncbi:Type IV prepilin peptidase TadV/CpaA [Vibrio chagasii]|nr:Type IV prepilin peptidase TadV/CpaA [Vibrio chagasii]CAH6836110.1 Type IV prepilin peptidase TadV/CpaA [Vibrio chagasii]CAH6857314.1 Type IV prepilin peptidase TadV/CpaA [Vibrio chagasii]CAH6914881.1 Type IV prepilin peptidase TadV/CpaA [Vibrio chagasii]CAH6937322.1 Type IV prepilin peptidase TadV/CpaA [Vibrio chagasii]
MRHNHRYPLFMNIEIINYSFLIALNLSIFSCVCIFDWKHRKIPNNLNKIALVVNLVVALSNGYLASSLPISIVCFVVGVLLWYLKVIGAGDVKLLTALVVGIQPDLVIATLISIGFMGGGLVLIMYIIGKIKRFNSYKKGIPYGIPIALSCFIFSTISTLSN